MYRQCPICYSCCIYCWMDSANSSLYTSSDGGKWKEITNDLQGWPCRWWLCPPGRKKITVIICLLTNNGCWDLAGLSRAILTDFCISTTITALAPFLGPSCCVVYAGSSCRLSFNGIFRRLTAVVNTIIYLSCVGMAVRRMTSRHHGLTIHYCKINSKLSLSFSLVSKDPFTFLMLGALNCR